MTRTRFLAIALCLMSATLTAQIAVIRTLPDEGPNQVKPEWSEPSPSPTTATAGETQIGGTLAVGGSASTADDAVQYGLYLDGTVDLVQFIGTGALSVGTDLQRKLHIEGIDEVYNGSIGFDADVLALSLGGGYAHRTEVLDESTTVDLDFLGTLAFIETLPLSLQAQYASETKTEDGIVDTDTDEWSIRTTAVGSIGVVGIDVASSFESGADFVESSSATQFAASVSLDLPVAPWLGVSVYAAPTIASSDITTTSLDTRIGATFAPSDGVGISVGSGRNDTWADVHAESWVFDVSASSTLADIISTSLGYEVLFSAETDTLRHQLNAGVQLRPETSMVRTFDTDVDFAYSDVVDAGVHVAALLSPLDGMEIDANYNVDVAESDNSAMDVTQGLDVAVDHILYDLLEYGLKTQVNTGSPETPDVVEQLYGASVTLSPRISGSRYPFTVSETVNIDSSEGVASTLAFLSQTPGGSAIRLSYGFAWEHVDLGDEADNVFRHLIGATADIAQGTANVAGDYGFVHGDHGARHDVKGRVAFPLTERLGIRVEGELSSFEEASERQTPFIVSIASTYEL